MIGVKNPQLPFDSGCFMNPLKQVGYLRIAFEVPSGGLVSSIFILKSRETNIGSKQKESLRTLQDLYPYYMQAFVKCKCDLLSNSWHLAQFFHFINNRFFTKERNVITSKKYKTYKGNHTSREEKQNARELICSKPNCKRR
ncbi:MAG: hypothetical protein RLZZ267_1150 [Bacillota bacterium]